MDCRKKHTDRRRKHMDRRKNIWIVEKNIWIEEKNIWIAEENIWIIEKTYGSQEKHIKNIRNRKKNICAPYISARARTSRPRRLTARRIVDSYCSNSNYGLLLLSNSNYTVTTVK